MMQRPIGLSPDECAAMAPPGVTSEPVSPAEGPTAGPITGFNVKKERKHSHYFKPCPFNELDIYRLILILEIVDPCLQHAFKKIALAGGRRHKSIEKDVQEAIDTLERWKEMREEEREATKH
jgi:hypothetical protein